jgi:hypothetical protein
MSELNYARHCGDKRTKKKGTGLVLFFRDLPPIPEEEYVEWAFWRMPVAAEAADFSGKLVYEDTDKRCARMRHRPKTCAKCQGSPGEWKKYP